MWNPDVETFDRGAMQSLQLERLRRTVDRLLANVAPMRERLAQAGVTSADTIRSLDDLRRLPFSTKDDLIDHYPFGLLAVPREQVVRIHASSGTKGMPKIGAYTARDLDVWSDVVARCLTVAGVRQGMIVHNAYGYGLFTGGLGLHQGAERIGCTVVPVSGGMSQRQIKLLMDLQADVLCATPSYALNIAETMRNAGVDISRLHLKIGIFGAEPWTDAMRATLERDLGGINALNLYGLTEIIGPGVAMECPEARAGLHINEDHFLPEVIDHATGEPLRPGEDGELVFTTLTKEAMPMLRYRTNDIASLDYAPCVCGRTTVRMSRVRARYDDMLIIRGVNLYPSEVERILLSIEGAAPHYQLVIDRPATMDELVLLCEPAHDAIDRGALSARVQTALQQQTGLMISVHVLDRDTVPRSEGKAQRVIDRRGLH